MPFVNGNPPALSSGLVEDCAQQLWKVQHRALVDVVVSAEKTDNVGTSSHRKNNNNNNNKGNGLELSRHSYYFVLRLHAFFQAFLHHAYDDDHGNDDDHDRGRGRSSPNNPQCQLVAAGAEVPRCDYRTKSAHISCLRPYAELAIDRRMARRRRKSTDPARTSSSTSCSNCHRGKASYAIRLVATGRHVLSMHQEDFLHELSDFEWQGDTPTEEFVRRDSFGAFLYHVPDQALPVLGCAMALAMVSMAMLLECEHQSQNLQLSNAIAQFVNSTQLAVRFVHVQPQVPMMDIKTGLVGKFLTVRGHVVKARPKRLRVVTADFVCTKCGHVQTHAFDHRHGRYSVPAQCRNPNKTTANGNAACRSRTFSMIRPAARYINVQDLRLQEAQEEAGIHAGRTPRQLDVECNQADSIDVCRPGDLVQVAATVRAVNTAAAATKSTVARRAKAESSTYQLYLTAHSITTLSETSHGGGGGGGGSSFRGDDESNAQRQRQQEQHQVVYTQQQLASIVRLCHADHRYHRLIERRAFPFDLLVRSLCPSIIGHEAVKAGLVLSLLGGTPAAALTLQDRSSAIRSNIHVMCCGDPGMGKSVLLLAAAQLAARSVFVGGNTSSTTGLTVTLTKEERGEAAMEAGALVLADQGVCCIDEFDKMPKSHQDGLLEAMEQQQVSIAKAGVVASLPARCSVIAAANPRHGNYDMSRSVAENLNMAKPVLSRFDLVFILRDRADQQQDQRVSSNIINLHRSKKQKIGDTTGGSLSSLDRSHLASNQRNSIDGSSSNSERMPLAERLAWVTDFQKQPLPADLVRDYIAYAREYCKPKLTVEAASVLKEYFMELRYPSDGIRKQDTVPITTRQLEALIRLSQARAKACLRDYVLKEDALDVVELMQYSVEQVHQDETGGMDPLRGGAAGQSQRKSKKLFVAELQRLVGPGAECTLDDMRRVADRVKCSLNDFGTMIDDLRNNGILMKKPNGSYQLVL